MSSVPMYCLMTEEDFNKAIKNGETCEEFAPSEFSVMEDSGFSYYSDYISSTEVHKTKKERIEAAKDIANYLGDFVRVDKRGVLEIPVDGKKKFATEKLENIKKLVENMTTEEFYGMGEYRIRQAVRDEGIFAYPLGENMPVGGYIQPMDAFMYDLSSSLDKPFRFVVIQTMWLHQ